MENMGAKFFKFSLLFVIIIVILSVSKIEGKRNSHGSSSHSSSHSSSGSHSSGSHHSTGSHVGFGNTHHTSSTGHVTGTSHPTGGFGTGSTHHTGSSHIGFEGSHTGNYGSGQHNGGLSSTHTVTGGIGFTNQGGPVHPTHVNPVHPVGTNTRPIGFEHVNNQHSTSGGATNHGGTNQHTTNNIYVTNTHITNTHHENVVHHPYQPHTVVIPGGGIQYHPPVQLQYVPPVHTVHVVPIQSYPTVVYTSGSGYDSGTSFLSGFLIGRVSGMLDNNNNNNQNSIVHHYDSTTNNPNQQQTNNYYTVHNYYQNRENVPTTFSIPGVNAVECPSNTSESLCVPNTNAICLKNETIMCVTNKLLTVPCGPDNTMQCVYTKIECNGNPSCNTTANQTYIDFYVPCVASVTLFNNIVVDTEKHDVQGNYELCVTAIAEPKKLQKPVSSK